MQVANTHVTKLVGVTLFGAKVVLTEGSTMQQETQRKLETTPRLVVSTENL